MNYPNVILPFSCFVLDGGIDHRIPSIKLRHRVFQKSECKIDAVKRNINNKHVKYNIHNIRNNIITSAPRQTAIDHLSPCPADARGSIVVFVLRTVRGTHFYSPVFFSHSLLFSRIVFFSVPTAFQQCRRNIIPTFCRTCKWTIGNNV